MSISQMGLSRVTVETKSSAAAHYQSPLTSNFRTWRSAWGHFLVEKQMISQLRVSQEGWCVTAERSGSHAG